MSSDYIYDPISINDSLKDSRTLIMPHQHTAVQAMSKYFQLDKDLPGRSGVVVMPTGSGKTYTTVNWLMTDAVAKGYRVIWLVHRQELIEQTFQEFRKQAPLLKGTGINKLVVLPISAAHLHISAAVGYGYTQKQKGVVFVCGIQSVANQNGLRYINNMLATQGRNKVVVVIDEAHHAVANGYQKVIRKIREINPNMVLLGLTATPSRMTDEGQAKLEMMFNVYKNKILNDKISGYVYEVTLADLIASKFLARPHYIKVETQIDAIKEYSVTDEDRLKFTQKHGELPDGLLDKIAQSKLRNTIIVNEYLHPSNKDVVEKGGYGKTLIFAVNQKQAEMLTAEFKSNGITCDYAISNRADSQQVIRDFKDNKLQVLINVQMMTEGSDVPDIQTVFLTRQTNSDSLLMQMIGRALRGKEAHGTEEAFIVDFHDKWDKYIYFMNPKKELTIFELDGTELDVEEALPEVAPAESPEDDALAGGDGEDDEEPSEDDKLVWAIYNDLQFPVVESKSVMEIPVGWYVATNEYNKDIKIFVYESQQEVYADVAQNIAHINEAGLTANELLDFYFKNVEHKPSEAELDALLDYLNDYEKMPPFYTFADRDKFDIAAIAETLKHKYQDCENSEAINYLQKLYADNPVLQNLYNDFVAFGQSVYNFMSEKKEADINTVDDREEYNIVENYYDLQELLEEIKTMFPKLRTDGLVKLAWSKHVVRKWFALCQEIPHTTYKWNDVLFQIHVNKLLSSPLIEREVIKYLLFHELLHGNGYWKHDKEFRSREWQYPDSARLDAELDSIGMRYNLDGIMATAVGFEVPELAKATVVKDYNHVQVEQESKDKSDDVADNNLHGDSVDENEAGKEDTAEVVAWQDTEKKEPDKEQQITGDDILYNKNASGVEDGFKYCMNCGYKLPEEANFCMKCGKKCE